MPHLRSARVLCAATLVVVAFCSPGRAQSTRNPLQLKPHHATAAVADLDRAIRWYEQMLGFKVVNRGERPNGMRFADLEIAAPASRNGASTEQGFGIGLVQNPAPSSQPPPAARSGWMHIVFSVPDPGRAFATLKSRGADITVRGNSAAAQITTFLLHDVDGNEIEIVQEP